MAAVPVIADLPVPLDVVVFVVAEEFAVGDAAAGGGGGAGADDFHTPVATGRLQLDSTSQHLRRSAHP
jgi:hypothetical protein